MHDCAPVSVPQHCALSSNGHCPGRAAQSQFTYSTDVTEHTYDEVKLGATGGLPSPGRYEMDAPLQSRYDTPRRLYYNQSPDAYEVVDEFVYPSEEYPALQDHNPLNTQPIGTIAQERPVPKPRQTSTFPRVNPTTAAPGHLSQSMYPNASPYIVMQPEDVVRQQAEEAAGQWGDDGGDALPAPLSAVANTSMTGSVGSTDSQTGGYVTINRQQLNTASEMAQLQGKRESAHSNDLGQGIAHLELSDQQKVIEPVESCYSDQLFEGRGRQVQSHRPGAPAGPSSPGPSASPKQQSPEPVSSGAQSYATAGPSSSKADAQVSRYCALTCLVHVCILVAQTLFTHDRNLD